MATSDADEEWRDPEDFWGREREYYAAEDAKIKADNKIKATSDHLTNHDTNFIPPSRQVEDIQHSIILILK